MAWPELVARVAGEVGEASAGAAGEDEDRLADRVLDLPLLERSVLHRGEEVAQPAEVLAAGVAVELVPEDEGELAPQARVAHLMERVGQVGGAVHLREVELERLDPVVVEASTWQPP